MLYTFIELSLASRMKACQEYLKEWKETHSNDDLSIQKVYRMLIVDNCRCYELSGNYAA